MKTIQTLSILALLLIATCAHAFSVIYPNGGQNLTQNVPTNITWNTDVGDLYYRVHITTDDGGHYDFIPPQVPWTPGIGTILWNVDHAPSTNCRILIEAWQLTGQHWEGCPWDCHLVNDYGIRETIMGGTFTISGPPQQTVHVDSPNGGETYTIGAPVSINYSVSGGLYVSCDIYLSTTGGADWASVPLNPAPLLCPGSSCTFPWFATPVTNEARVKVVKHLLDGSTIEDESDGNFAITPLPYIIHVVYPNGGENLSQHVPTNTSWTIGDGNVYNFFRVYLRTDAQPDWQQLGNDVLTPGMLWNVDHEPATGCRIKVEGYTSYLRYGEWRHILRASDESDNSFTIGSQTVHVDYPNGSESFLIGVPTTITYSVSGGAYVSCDLLLSADGGATYPFPIDVVLAQGSPVSYTWMVPGPVTNTARIKIIKHLLDGNTIEDVSDANFSIVAAPSVTVTSPNAANLTIGQTVTINWVNQGGHVDSYSIDRSNDGGVSYPEQLVAGLSGQATSYDYVVQGPASNTVKFRVTANYFQGALHVDDANDNNCSVEAANASGPTQMGLPTTVELAQNFPNPFNPTTTIAFDLPNSVAVKLTVHNILGQTVATLANNVMHAGHYEVRFDGANLPSGMYFYHLQAGDVHFEKRMMLAK